MKDRVNLEVLAIAGVISAALQADGTLEKIDKLQPIDNGFRLTARIEGTPVYVDIHWP